MVNPLCMLDSREAAPLSLLVATTTWVPPSPPQDPKNIRNKIKRSMVVHANKARDAAARKEAREQRQQAEQQRQAAGGSSAPKPAARTLDNTRDWDDTFVDKQDPELLADEADDEFADIFSGSRAPKIMITTKVRPSGPIFLILKELIALFPNSFYYKRGVVGWDGTGSAPQCAVLSR